MPFQIAPLYDKMLKGMPLNIISYKKAIWKGIVGPLKGIVQKLEDSPSSCPVVNVSGDLGVLFVNICWSLPNMEWL